MDDLDIQLKLQAVITEREAMVAENAFRAYVGQSPAYVEDSFMILVQRFQALLVEYEARPSNG